mmetsp:Transcript_40121/g.125616  ORF Transcript_40121/g.125616 Transcript_40121/m.125616 type:complete len:309 (-) Transcript_40121:498-1424(-)
MAGNLQGRLSQTFGDAAQRSTGVLREMKGFFSSELEQVILKITRPNEMMPKTKHVENLLVATHDTPAQFEVYPHILKKLWNRMLEEDWRTALKATYMLHKFAADGAPQHSVELKKTFASMARQYCARHKNTYFNLEQVMNRDFSEKTGGEEEVGFLSAYMRYTFFRTRTFRPHFAEITAARSAKDKAGILLKIQRLLALAKNVAESSTELVDAEVAAVCLEKVLEDAAEMMAVLVNRIESSSASAGGRDQGDDDTQQLVDWYQENVVPTRQWLRRHARALSKSLGLSPKVALRKLTFPSLPSSADGGD